MPEKYRCEPCSLEFDTQEEMDEHEKEHHSEA